MNSQSYTPPITISRDEFLVRGSDGDFRRSIYAMIQCVGRLLACRDAFGRELSLTPSQFAILMGVAGTQGEKGVAIRDLAEHVALAPTHVTTEVRRLEEVGLLIKRPSETDRRSVCVSLLPKAKEEIARISPFIRVVNDVLFRDIDAAALRVAHRVAQQLIVNSDSALAEVRRHALTGAAGPVFADPADVASTSRNAARPATRHRNDDSDRRKKAIGRPRSG